MHPHQCMDNLSEATTKHLQTDEEVLAVTHNISYSAFIIITKCCALRLLGNYVTANRDSAD